ncbi:MAG: hypothetical protein IT204_25900 [Fimbriimonadaceae bacterium]|nr:hypothetical protein [Fimbriimonadaceae bacterium]
MGASFGPAGAYRLTSWHPPQPIGQLRRVRQQRARRIWMRLVLAMSLGLAASLLQLRPPVAALWRPAAALASPAPPRMLPTAGPPPTAPPAAAAL